MLMLLSIGGIGKIRGGTGDHRTDGHVYEIIRRHREERVHGGSLNRLVFHVSGPRPGTTILAYELVY